jgi:L-lactate dehydrogenase (cytochrome)
VLVSNHGGRQLDSAPSTATILPSIVDAVGDRTEVYVDSGIRSGIDVLKFLGLGARGCFIGRAYLYGLGAYGQAGVTKALEILRDELDIAMALTAATDAEKVPRSVILSAPGVEQVRSDPNQSARRATDAQSDEQNGVES